MQFWCSARDTAWTWEWQAYPGVWLFILLLGLAFRRWEAAGARRDGIRVPPPSPLFFVGLLVLWLALDWPIGRLGASHLASVHMLQFVLIALVAPPILLASLSPSAVDAISPNGRLAALLKRVTAPIPAAAILNVTVLLTHMPPIVDRLMQSQLGSMLIDLSWFTAGIIFWWPLMLAFPARQRFVPPLRILYIIVALMFSPVMFGLVGFLVYAERPLYGIYELAPPLPGISSRADHQLAGVLMSISSAAVAFTGLSVIFFRWSRSEG